MLPKVEKPILTRVMGITLVQCSGLNKIHIKPTKFLRNELAKLLKIDLRRTEIAQFANFP